SKARRDGVIDEIFGRAVAADRSARGGEHDEARRVAADDRQVQRAAAEVEDEARSRADVGRVRGRDRFSDETDLTKAGELRRRALVSVRMYASRLLWVQSVDGSRIPSILISRLSGPRVRLSSRYASMASRPTSADPSRRM